MTTRPDVGLDEAIAICKEHGLAVIAREKITTISAIERVQNAGLHQFRKEPGFLESVVSASYRAMAPHLAGKGICRIETEMEGFDTIVRLDLKVIPWEIETDPLLQMMRDADRARR